MVECLTRDWGAAGSSLTGITVLCPWARHIWASAWDFQQCGMCDQRSLRSACAYAQFDQSLCWSLEYSMCVKLLTEHHLEFLSLKGSCRGSSESTLVKMSNCWKSHAAAHLSLLSTSSTQENPSQHNWKIVDWDAKNQIKQNVDYLFPDSRAFSTVESNSISLTASLSKCSEKYIVWVTGLISSRSSLANSKTDSISLRLLKRKKQ